MENTYSLSTTAQVLMEEFLQAALLFWLPLICLPFGTVVALSRKEGRRPVIAWSVVFLAFIMIIFSWLTVPASDSSAGGHLLLSIIGPTILMGLGCFMIIFTGNIPVRRLAEPARPVGLMSLALGVLWLLMMHLSSPPIWRHQVNPYWLVWWPTFLFSVILVTSFVIGALLMVGENRRKEASLMTVFGFLFLGLLLTVISLDGTLTTAEEMRSHLWLVSADILGTVLGILIAVVIVAGVVTKYEKSLPEPNTVSELTAEEKELLLMHLGNNLGGGNK
jgi:MFS family permease